MKQSTHAHRPCLLQTLATSSIYAEQCLIFKWRHGAWSCHLPLMLMHCCCACCLLCPHVECNFLISQCLCVATFDIDCGTTVGQAQEVKNGTCIGEILKWPCHRANSATFQISHLHASNFASLTISTCLLVCFAIGKPGPTTANGHQAGIDGAQQNHLRRGTTQNTRPARVGLILAVPSIGHLHRAAAQRARAQDARRGGLVCRARGRPHSHAQHFASGPKWQAVEQQQSCL